MAIIAIEPESGKPKNSTVKHYKGEEPLIVRLKNFLNARYTFRLNIVSNDLEAKPARSTTDWQVLNPDDLNCQLYEANYKAFDKPLSALLGSSYVPRYDPLAAYFEQLPKWDESQPDYIRQLAGFVKTTDQKWFDSMFKKMLVRVVACGIGSLPFNKHCFILKGEQNDGKTSFVRFLFPPAMQRYATEFIDFQSKDGYISLATNLFVFLDDMDKMPEPNIGKIKAMLTTATIKLRRPFGKRDHLDRRRASFFGTTNQDEFLTDTTGNVRWLVFDVRKILHDYGGEKGYSQNIDIDLVWAQAYTLCKGGYAAELTGEEIKYSEKKNKEFMVRSYELELVEQYIKPSKPHAPGAEHLTATDIYNRLATKTRAPINVYKLQTAIKAQCGKRISNRHKGQKSYSIQGYWVIMK